MTEEQLIRFAKFWLANGVVIGAMFVSVAVYFDWPWYVNIPVGLVLGRIIAHIIEWSASSPARKGESDA